MAGERWGRGRVKILYLITRGDRGGAQVHVTDLLSHLNQDFTAVLATGEEGYLCDEARRLGVRTHIVPSMRQPMSPIQDIAALMEIVRLIRREQPHLIHAHTSKAGLLGRVAGMLTRTPVIFTAHTWSFADGIPSWQRRIAVPIERMAARTGGKIITVSLANARLAQANLVGDPRNVITVWNGVPDVRWRAKPGSRDELRIIMVARFVAQKDQQLLVRALAPIKERWTLQFAGDGPRKAEVEGLVKELGVSNRVEFLGDREDTPELLAKADLFVLASNWEGLPMSILEAMRAGLPVIATQVGGVEEAIRDGVTGLLTRPGDLGGLRTALESLMTQPGLCRRMGEAGRRRYDEHFRLERMLNETFAVYRDAALAPQLSRAKNLISMSKG